MSAGREHDKSAWAARRGRAKPRPPIGLGAAGAPILLFFAFGALGPDPKSAPAHLLSWQDGLWICGLVAAAFFTGLAKAHYGSLWHAFANATAEENHHTLKSPWVVDGDTIDDRFSGVRYRLANVDAPETGDNARCYRERRRGELAARAAIRLVRRARTVTVRRTWRKDKYGRRIAFVYVDGADLGEALIKRGLARPWRGGRARWCGPDGGLAKIAERGGAPFDCATCRTWTRS